MKTILFDVDGVLLDSFAAHQRIWQQWSELHTLDFATVWAATHGRRIVETLADVTPKLDPVVEEAKIRAIMLAQGDSAFPAHQGAQGLLAALPAGRWALVTSARGDNVRRRFVAAGLAIPDVVIGAESVSHGKPSPEGYLMAAKALGVEPQDCLVVEDTPAGIHAGLAAGMTVLAVATTHRADELTHAHLHATSLHTAVPDLLGWLEPAADLATTR